MIAAVATMTVGAATTIAVTAGTNPAAMIQVAEIEATAAAAVADLNADRRVITVQRPCAAAPRATVVITAEIAPLSPVHPAVFAIRIADVIEVRTKTAVAIRAATGAKIRIGTRTKTAAVIGAAIEIATKIAWATGAGIRIKIGIVTATDIAIVIGMAGTGEITIAIAMVTRFTM